MGLKKYSAKRNFSTTPEPKAKIKKKSDALSFVVQRHKATRLHYDFRLEMDGVLKSWAVPKGPSMNPADKRLAMMVEDHPYEYKDFTGVIPEGYGAGIVEIWDKGNYSDIEHDDKNVAEKKLKSGLKSGNLKFTLTGKKLKGEFALVKLNGTQDNAWLLLKHKDKFATNKKYDSENETSPSSPINKWLSQNKSKKKIFRTKKNQGEKFYDFIHPMLAMESEKAFNDPDWIFEIKWDGYRAIAEISKRDVKFYSRNGFSFKNTYPGIYSELKKIKQQLILDGEVVVLNEDGVSDFQKLQHYRENPEYPLCYYVFDILSFNSKNVCHQPLIERKKLLKKILKESTAIKFSDHIEAEGVKFFKAAQERNLEGIIGKKCDSIYYKGKRSNEWLKIKHHHSQEAIVAGFTEPTGGRKYFGALVLAVKDGSHLKYVGHTGSGFTDKTLKETYNLLKPSIRKTSPFNEQVKTNAPVTWVLPKYVCEIKFTEWTSDHRMRHPVFLQMRKDKNINEVNMENIKLLKKQNKRVVGNSSSPKGVKGEKAAEKGSGNEMNFGKVIVKTSNRNKIYWPKEKITKGMVIDYYQDISDYILPYLKDRPESLRRNPNGINDIGFFHKDAGVSAPEWIKSEKIYSVSAKKEIDYIICNDKATMAYLNNLGCIELNPWNSTIKNLDNPDYMIIDIDPSEKNNFEQVIETANVFKEILDKAGAASFCKTSGSTGLHIFVPTGRKYSYEQVKDFAHLICSIANERISSLTTLERNLQKRGNKKIYLDYLQNRRGQTLACAYSLRPRIGATVSTPLEWKELKKGLNPSDFTITTIFERIEKTGDLFKGIFGKGVDLQKALDKIATN